MAAEDWVVDDSTDATPPGPVNRFLTAVAGPGTFLGSVTNPSTVVKSVVDDPRGALQTTDDAVRAAANAATFGMADRFAGYMGGEGTDAEVAKSAAARERSPVASTVGDVAGAATIPGLPAEALAAKMGGGLLARGGAYGLTGAATGAAQGAGNTYTGDLPDYLRNAAVGGALGGAFGTAGGAMFGGRPQVPRAEVPTLPELQRYKSNAYDELNANEARYNASHLAQVADQLENRFWTRDNFQRRDSPATFAAIDQMRAPAAGAAAARAAGDPNATATVSPANIDFVRRGINNISLGPDSATDRTSGRLVKRALDEFVERPPPGAVLPGYDADAQRAGWQGATARLANAAFERSRVADALQRRAIEVAGSQNSGLNVEANLRTQYRNLIAPDRKGVSAAQREGFDPTEIERIRRFASGKDSPGRNALRYAGNLLGGGGGMGAQAASIGAGLATAGAGIGGAAYTDDPRWAWMVAAPALGLGLRGAANRVARNAADRLNETIRMNSPLYQDRLLAPGGMGPAAMARPTIAKSSRDAIALELLKRNTQPQSPDGASDWR